MPNSTCCLASLRASAANGATTIVNIDTATRAQSARRRIVGMDLTIVTACSRRKQFEINILLRFSKPCTTTDHGNSQQIEQMTSACVSGGFEYRHPHIAKWKFACL